MPRRRGGSRSAGLGASRALDEVTHRVPPACQDGGSGESERQLDVLGTGRPVEHRHGHIQGFARTALEAEQPGPLGGRGGAVRLDVCELVEQPLGRAERSVGQVAPYQREQQVGSRFVDTRLQQELGCRRVVVRTAAGEEDLGRSPGQHCSFRWQHEGEHGLVGERVPPAQGAGVHRQQPGLL